MPNHFVAVLPDDPDTNSTFVIDSSPLHSSTPEEFAANVDENETSDNDDETSEVMKHVASRRHLSDPTEIYHHLRDGTHVQPFIPAGLKSDVMFIIENLSNVAHRQIGQHSVFADDCAIWMS